MCADQWSVTVEALDYIRLAVDIHSRVVAVQPSGYWITDDDITVTEGFPQFPAPAPEIISASSK